MDFKYSTDIIPVSEARARLTELIDEVQTGATKVITRNGKASAVLVDVHEFEQLQQLAKQLRQEKDLEQLQRGLLDLEKGRVVDEKTFRSSLKQRVRRLEKRR